MINRNEYLTTGEFAKIFDINKDTLFFYDKIKLFCPKITDQNGYRYYHVTQLIEYRTIDILKDSGLSLSHIKEYLDNKSPQNFMTVASSQISQLQKRKAAIESYIDQLSRTNTLINLGLVTEYGIPRITNLPSERFIAFPLHSAPAETKKWKINVAEVLVYCKKNNLLTDFLRGSLLKKENIIKNNFTKDISLIRVSNTVNSENLIIMPQGLFGVIIYNGSYDNIASAYTTLINFINKNNFVIIGDAYELELVGYLLTDKKDNFVVQISIPIAPK